MRNRILVTGASGFIGRNLCNKLLLEHEDDCESLFFTSRIAPEMHPRLCDDYRSKVTHLGCELSNETSVKSLMAMARPNLVFHLAGNPIVKTDNDNPTKITMDNVIATHNLLEHCPAGARFVFASSATVYGGENKCLAETDLTCPNSVYGATKLAGEALVCAYTALGLVSGVRLRMVANTGKFATHGVVKDLLRKLQSKSETLDVIGDSPGSTKPFLYVGDSVRAFLHFGFDSSLTGAFNISPHDCISVEIVANLIMNTTGIVKPIRWLGEGANWKGDRRFVWVNSVKAKESGWIMTQPNSQLAIIQGVKDAIGRNGCDK